MVNEGQGWRIHHSTIHSSQGNDESVDQAHASRIASELRFGIGLRKVGEREMNSELVLERRDANVLWLTLNQPEKRNPLSSAMIATLSGLLEKAYADETVRAIVLASTGPVFSAGHDLSEMNQRADEDAAAFSERIGSILEKCATMMKRMVNAPKPVIACVQGTATAAGCQLVSACDLAIAASDAGFCTPGVNVGVFCTTPLVGIGRNLSRKHALEMALTGEFFDARDAERFGLINRHVPAEGSETGYLELSSDYFEDHTFDLPLAAFGQANVKNLSMALGVGLRSGVSFELLQKRLYDWKPSPLRGEVRVSGQQVYYADCYNANPVSMQEAISTFSNRFDKLPKLYVLGSMNELGDVSEDLHKSTGAKLQLQKGDRAVLCGPESEAILEGMVDSGSDIGAITLVERAEDARMLVDSFKGAILLKGSRTYGLECLMPKVETYEERRLAAC